jgi:sugar transferase (PEP-CTERM/EpsH1 system associated)
VRIVFVASRFPYPVEKGDKLRAFHQIRLLSLDHEIHLVAISHQAVAPEHIRAMDPYCKSIRIFRINKWLVPVQLMLGWLEGLPLQVSYFLDRTIKRKVQYYIIHLEPDHVFCQLIRAAPYVRALPFPKTLDYMDVFSVGMQQLADRMKPFGFIFKWESARLAAFERTIYKDFDRHTIISVQDRNRLKLASSDHVAVIPNGVDPAFHPGTSANKPSHDVVFVGNLGYGPNKEAALYLVNTLKPELRLLGLSIRILLAGARPGNKIRRLQHPDEVTVKGWVDDIREAYADGRILVAPMFSGLGLQNKILEAMAMGLPCVTTSMVNNAIGAEVNKEILIGDDAKELAQHIYRLLTNDDLYRQLASNGRAFVLKNYQWEDQVDKLEAVLNSKNVYVQS